MSYEISQLSPLSTRRANLGVSIQGPWNSPSHNHRNVEFFRCWLIYDQELDPPRCVNRDVMLGMALVFAISASFWAGVGLAIAQVWK